MNTITFECSVTEYDILPQKDNDEVVFCLNEKCLIINLMDSSIDDKILAQTEIDKSSAIELAKLILLKYT